MKTAKIWIVVGMLGDVEVAIEATSSLDAAIYRACALQAEIAMENDEDEEDVENYNSQLAQAVKKKTDDGRYDYALVEDDMGIEWRFKRTRVLTAE